MQINMYVDGEEKKEMKRILKASGIVLWAVLIGVSIILASQAVLVVR